MGRNRKNKLEWFASFKRSFDETTSIETKTEPDDIKSYLRDITLASARVLNDAAKRGVVHELAVRYAHGESVLNTNTQEARDEYMAVIHHEWLPEYRHRRVLDATIARIKDQLKGFALRIIVAELIEKYPNSADGEIASMLYQMRKSKEIQSYIGCARASYVKNIRNQMAKNGNKLPLIVPCYKPKLQLSQMDDFASVRRVNETSCELSFSYGRRKTKMVFDVPSKIDYQTGKICKPDIMLSSDDENADVVFSFSVSHATSSAYDPVCSLGVDVGAIYPFTCGIIGDDWYSQVIYPNARIMGLVDKVNELQRQKNDLMNDIKENERDNRTQHIREVLERKIVEKERLAGKISRLRREVARLSANRIVDIAYQAQAEIVLEELAWSTPSHYFFHKMMHEAIENLAHKRGIKTRHVSAKDTSQVDPVSGSRVSQGVRVSAPVTAGKRQYLSSCSSNAYGVTSRGCKVRATGRVKQHDGVAPLNVGCRGFARLRDGRVRLLASKRQVRLRFRRVCWSGATVPAAGSEPGGSSVLCFRDGSECSAGVALARAGITHPESQLVVAQETTETEKA